MCRCILYYKYFRGKQMIMCILSSRRDPTKEKKMEHDIMPDFSARTVRLLLLLANAALSEEPRGDANKEHGHHGGSVLRVDVKKLHGLLLLSLVVAVGVGLDGRVAVIAVTVGRRRRSVHFLLLLCCSVFFVLFIDSKREFGEEKNSRRRGKKRRENLLLDSPSRRKESPQVPVPRAFAEFRLDGWTIGFPLAVPVIATVASYVLQDTKFNRLTSSVDENPMLLRSAADRAFERPRSAGKKNKLNLPCCCYLLEKLCPLDRCLHRGYMLCFRSRWRTLRCARKLNVMRCTDRLRNGPVACVHSFSLFAALFCCCFASFDVVGKRKEILLRSRKRGQ